jgi:prepilin-type N-terminal cleavage/methylation domain-containing protein
MSSRPQHAEAGFSLMELLVTIVLAGIVFAAMIPVYIDANTKGFADTMRLVSLSVAQDKIEKVRQLPYDSITLANLQSSSFQGGEFGTSQTVSTGQATRPVNIAYTVTSYPAGSSGLTSQYKIVSVTTRWTAPPGPVKPAALQTIVYRQYTGPDNVLTTNPAADLNQRFGDSSLSSITLTAKPDLSGGLTVASVQFTVAGPTTASQEVKITDTNQASGYWYDSTAKTFNWTWDCSLATNGLYTLQSIAISNDGFPGESSQRAGTINHLVPPAPPTAVIATAFDSRVDLTWSASPATDLANYVIYRGPSASGPWTYLDTRDTTPLIYADHSAVNGETYYSAIRALSSTGMYSTYAVSNSASPVGTDTTPPTAPGGLTVVKVALAPTLRITWTASTDPGTPSTGISKYEIWRSPDNSTWTKLYDVILPALLTYDDVTAGYSSSWYYRVRAFDGATGVGNGPGPFCAAVGGGPTDAAPRGNIVISIKSGNNGPYNVWVMGTSTLHYWTKANPAVDNGTSYPAAASLPKNGSVTFYQLPYGTYTVYVNSGGFNALTNKPYTATVNAASVSVTGVVFP